MTPPEDNVDRWIRLGSIAVVASLLGSRFAVMAYSGPSIARGLSIAGGIAMVVGLLSFVFGRRFWRVMLYLFFFAC